MFDIEEAKRDLGFGTGSLKNPVFEGYPRAKRANCAKNRVEFSTFSTFSTPQSSKKEIFYRHWRREKTTLFRYRLKDQPDNWIPMITPGYDLVKVCYVLSMQHADRVLSVVEIKPPHR